MQRYTVYLYLKTALHVSGGTSTHHQERIELYLQRLVFVTPLLLSAAIVEELEPTGLSVLWVAYACPVVLWNPKGHYFVRRLQASTAYNKSNINTNKRVKLW
jgi:hypothetical protein